MPTELKRYELPGLAAVISDIMKEESARGYQAEAMKDFYFKVCGIPEKDPIYRSQLGEFESGGNVFVTKAINMYGGEYQNELGKTTISEFIAYVATRGYTDIPDKLKALVNKYKDKKILEVQSEAKTNDEAKALMIMIGNLQKQVFEGKLIPELMGTSRTTSTKKNLEELASTLP